MRRTQTECYKVLVPLLQIMRAILSPRCSTAAATTTCQSASAQLRVFIRALIVSHMSTKFGQRQQIASTEPTVLIRTISVTLRRYIKQTSIKMTRRNQQIEFPSSTFASAIDGAAAALATG